MDQFPQDTDFSNWLQQHRQQSKEQFTNFLRFPSISAHSEQEKALRGCSAWLQQQLEHLGFTVSRWNESGIPVLFATRPCSNPHAPTLLLYGHYDVQPADPIELWQSHPFEPREQDGIFYARGAQDNKGQCFYTLKGIEALLDLCGDLPVHLKWCIDGEEEVGSPSLLSLLPQKSDALKADALAVIDLGIPAPNSPALSLGLRGLVTMDMRISTATSDLHSGLHGGIALNALQVLTDLLHSLHDATGKIAVPHFYDQVSAPPQMQLPKFDAQHYTDTTGAHPYGGETGLPPLERGWWRPTLEINGISGGYSGEGFKTVIPAKALAKISCRLVPHQEPHRIAALIRDFLREHLPQGAILQVDVHPGVGLPVRTQQDTPIIDAFARALEDVFPGKPCQFVYDGATIPIASALQQVSGGDLALVGLGLPTDQIHAPNEHFSWDRIELGATMIAKALCYFGHRTPQPGPKEC